MNKITSNNRSKHTKIRRSKRKKKTCNVLKIITVNARGIKSKLVSLRFVISQVDPDIVALSETNLKGKQKVSVKGYTWIGKNRKGKDSGGVGFLVRNSLRNSIVIENTNDNKIIEALWIKIILQKQSYLNIWIYYGKQESRFSEEAISDELHLLETETARFASQQHHVLLLDDFNAKIGSDNFGIPNGDANISRSCQLLHRLIHNCHLDILNSSTVCTGIWTRINTKKNVPEVNPRLCFSI